MGQGIQQAHHDSRSSPAYCTVPRRPQGSEIGTLRTLFEAFYIRLCVDLGVARDPKDFDQSLKQLESSFLAIEDCDVDFINPSAREFLAGYLADGALLPVAAATCTSAMSAKQIWSFAKEKLDWL